MNNDKKVELLSPAGSLEALYAAVQNGCNAVYVGGKQFSARQYASNFSKDDLKTAIDYCHLREVKLYLTINILYKEDEIEPLIYFIKEMYLLGIDAVIMQDFGVAMKVKEVFPELELHGSTQMNIHHIEGVRFLQSMGYKRIVLSRELHLSEIRDITTHTDMEVECFVHGALCVSYSGQCLMSSFLGGRSGNRGRCAGPCRLPYTLLEDGKPVEDVEGRYLLSPKDIQTLTLLPQLIEAGIHSFKIEGRMKRPEYVAAVTAIYRKYINLYYDKTEQYQVDEEDIKMLTQLFNRGGFSQGYVTDIQSNSGKEMMSFKKPKNWGLFLGRVTQYNKRTKVCKIKAEEPLGPGDGIEIWTQQEPHPGTAISKNSNKGDIITVTLDSNISAGDLVYKTKDKQMLDQLQRSFERDSRKRTIWGHVKAIKGLPLVINTWDNAGNYIEVSGSIVEQAKNQPIACEQLKQQIQKTGNTPFDFIELSIDCDEDIYIPIGQMNNLRREAMKKLADAILSKDQNRKINDIVFTRKILKEKNVDSKYITILLKKFDQISHVLDQKVKRIYGEISSFSIEEIKESSRLCHQHGIEFYVALPMINRKHTAAIYRGYFEQLETSEIDGYLIRTYGQIHQVQNSKKKKILDYTLNIFNNETIRVWESLKISGVTLSPELNIQEIQQLVGRNMETIIYGYLPLMISEQCVIGNTIGRKEDHHFCSQRNHRKEYILQDRLGENFFLQSDCKQCISKVYNGKVLFLAEYMKELLSIPVEYYRLQFTIETPQEIEDMVQCYAKALQYPNTSNDIFHSVVQLMKAQGYTKGHYFRGVE